MATMILSAAGSSLGAASGGSLLGIGAATLGRAVGGVAGSLVDQQLLGRGSSPAPSGRIERLRVQSAGEGDAIPRVFGRIRVAGQIIWSSRFKEHVDRTEGGGKNGGARGDTFRYTISFAVALCEGVVSRLGRTWADGNEISLSDFPHRLHKGRKAQLPDPLIDAVEGGAPAFRDIAYVVFEDLDLSQFGSRIPQFNFEVWRQPASVEGDARPDLSRLAKAVALSPGSGEFSLETEKVRRLIGPGRAVFENVNTSADRADIRSALDQLAAEAPAVAAISLVVSWFGDDLRCDRCDVKPCIEARDKKTDPHQWSVSGADRGEADLVSLDDAGRPIFGGTPSDGSVVRAIRTITARGDKVMFYPFILMDIPAANTKLDPWTGAAPQPAFPWRGRITLDRAPGVGGSVDKNAAAAAQVRSFFGDAAPGDFIANADTVSYSGPAEWSFRRFILHYAHLCALAGGVDSFCIGSELRGLTQIRSDATVFPAVEELRQLAAEVKSILGAGVKVGYAADWSEYFGYHPSDGSGDVLFHLDPLWSSANIDFIGIDNYFPLSDWRYSNSHLDDIYDSVYNIKYLNDNIEGGEGFDWFYADQDARDAQVRSEILDGAFGEHWLFRPKDIRNWWLSQHFDRPSGVRSAIPTAWSPQSKPIWFTEIGCPAVDLGANQPNVFFDPKSSESFLPYYSRGVRDDFMQRRFLEASLSYWNDPANNPLSVSYDGRMIDAERSFIWTWDARPWPDFPARTSVWSDGPNYRLGHWITGRLGAASLADVVAEICDRVGVPLFDVSELVGVVQGYMLDDASSGRAALQPLMTAFEFDAIESGDVLLFRHRDRRADVEIDPDFILLADRARVERSFSRAPDGELPAAIACAFIDGERDYEAAAIEARHVGSSSSRIETLAVPLVLDSAAAQDIAERHLASIRSSRDGVAARIAHRHLGLEVGDIVSFADRLDHGRFRVDALDDDSGLSATLSRLPDHAAAPKRRAAPVQTPEPVFPAGPVESLFLDLPSLAGAVMGPKLAAFAFPWKEPVVAFEDAGEDEFRQVARITRPASVGELLEDLPAGSPDVWMRGDGVLLRLYGGGLTSLSPTAVLNGGNRAALRAPGGDWEIIQFQSAELVAADVWRLRLLLRGQSGTEPFIGAPCPAGSMFVLLDDALADLPSPSALRGVERSYRVGPATKPLAHDSFTPLSGVDRAIRLRPFAPAHLRAKREEGSGAVVISWIRRTRIDGDDWESVEPPLGESSEAYIVRIGDFSESVVAESRFLWSAAAQAGHPAGEPVSIMVAQISEQFGEGPSAKVIYHG